jgi:hypothetical protein
MAPAVARPVASGAKPKTACIHQSIRLNLPLTTYAKASDK